MGLIIERIGVLPDIRGQKLIIEHQNEEGVTKEELTSGRVIMTGTYSVYIESEGQKVGRGVIFRTEEGQKNFEVSTEPENVFKRVEGRGNNQRVTFWIDAIADDLG